MGFNRVFIRDRLLEGVEPGDILDLLEDFDTGHQTRQYGIADTRGGTATFTGTGAAFRIEPQVMMGDAQGLPELATSAVVFKNLQI